MYLNPYFILYPSKDYPLKKMVVHIKIISNLILIGNMIRSKPFFNLTETIIKIQINIKNWKYF